VEMDLLAVSAHKARVKMAQADAQDFDALFAEHWNRVYAVLFRLVGDPAEAQDLALEVFWRLYRQPTEYFDQPHLIGWLYRVATNLGYNALRANKRREHYESEAELDSFADRSHLDPAAQVEIIDRRQQVHRVLAGMKSRSTRLLVLRHSGFSYAEIAAVLNISPASVGTLLARAEREFESAFTAAYGKDI
jgi:RNA polymerase sigma-70 factor (ECF subfamily)